MSAEEIGKVRGGKSHQTFKVFYDSSGKGKVFIGSGMFGKDRIASNIAIRDAQHAMKIAAAHVVDK